MAKQGIEVLRHWLSVLRPISWWFILVLILYTIRTHQYLSDETNLTFDTKVEGRVSDTVSATVDGHPVQSSSRISVGWHRITFAHRKAETFSTNLFVWYGGCDLGDVVLKRTKGRLTVTADPPARSLRILGPEFRSVLSGSSGITSSVPTDIYQVIAYWGNHDETSRVSVLAGRDSFLRYSPSLGAIRFLSQPAGARIIDAGGKELGITPITLQELGTGLWKGELRLDGFVPARIRANIWANETNSLETKLVSWQYAQAMEQARKLLSAHEYDNALEAVTAALKIDTENLDARALQSKIALGRHLQRSRDFYESHRYTDAGSEIEAALRIDPENAEVRALQAAITNRQEEVIAEEQRRQTRATAERTRRQRLDRLEEAMTSVTREHVDANFFDLQKLVLTNSVKELGSGIRGALLTKAPVFELKKDEWMGEDLFVLEGKQPAHGGLRVCLIVGTQSSDGESVVVFRVLEYETHLNLNLGDVIRITDGRPALVALPNQRDRVIEGIRDITERINSALK